MVQIAVFEPLKIFGKPIMYNSNSLVNDIFSTHSFYKLGFQFFKSLATPPPLFFSSPFSSQRFPKRFSLVFSLISPFFFIRVCVRNDNNAPFTCLSAVPSLTASCERSLTSFSISMFLKTLGFLLFY